MPRFIYCILPKLGVYKTETLCYLRQMDDRHSRDHDRLAAAIVAWNHLSPAQQRRPSQARRDIGLRIRAHLAIHHDGTSHRWGQMIASILDDHNRLHGGN